MSELLNRYPGYFSSDSPLLCKDESSQMRKVGLISVVLPNKPNRLPLSPLVCHSNFLEGNAGGKKCSHYEKICCISNVWFLPKAPRGTVVFPEYKRQQYHKGGCSIPRADKSSESCQRHHSSHPSNPPKPTAAYPNYPTGIENSSGLCLFQRLLKK